MEAFRISFLSIRDFIRFLLALILTLWSYGYFSVKLQSFYPSSLLASTFPYLSLCQPSSLHLLHCALPWDSAKSLWWHQALFPLLLYFFLACLLIFLYLTPLESCNHTLWVMLCDGYGAAASFSFSCLQSPERTLPPEHVHDFMHFPWRK